MKRQMLRWLALGGCVVAISCASDSPSSGADGSGTASDGSTGAPPADGTTGTPPSPTTAATTEPGGTTMSPGDTTAGPADTTAGDTTGGPPPGTVAECFEGAYVNEVDFGPDYDQFGVTVGSHCYGTNHQDIDGIERVVFLGDSVTVGSRPTLPAQSYRSVLAEALAAKFGLSFGDVLGKSLWQSPNPFNGQSVQIRAGDFASCAKWGARNDDLLQDGNQIAQCFTDEELLARTLIVWTSGGNDINAITQDAIDGIPQMDLMLEAEDMIVRQREAIDWLLTPDRFPNGVFIIFANPYEFTDGTGEVESCDVSALAGFDQPVPAVAELADLVVWIEEEYGKMAAETQTDMIFTLEEFCGHGFNHDNPLAPCYRGPGAELWFDLTCIHPNPTGHQHIADMFMAVVDE